MKLRYLTLLLALFLVPAVRAQYTTVSSTGVTDTGSVPYANGSFTILLNNTTGQTPYFQGLRLPPSLTEFSGLLDSSGAFSISIPSSAYVLAGQNGPANQMTWTFSVCAAFKTGCYSVNISVSGATDDVTATINAAAVALTFKLPNNIPVGPNGACFEGAGASGAKWATSCGGGSGNVTGPASSTNNDVAGFNGTTGKTILDLGSFGALVTATPVADFPNGVVANCATQYAIFNALTTGTTATCDANLTENGTTLSYSGTGGIDASGGPIVSGTPPGGASGVDGIACAEGASTGWTPTAGTDYLRCDSTKHAFVNSNNGGSEYALAQTIGSGTAAMGTAAITSGTCATAVTVAATGVATTDTITYDPNGDPTAITGYAPSATGSLYIWAYPTAGNVNFKVCNNTSGSITPSALTLNWRVTR